VRGEKKKFGNPGETLEMRAGIKKAGLINDLLVLLSSATFKADHRRYCGGRGGNFFCQKSLVMKSQVAGTDPKPPTCTPAQLLLAASHFCPSVPITQLQATQGVDLFPVSARALRLHLTAAHPVAIITVDFS
jgi:hypothetical protein